MDVDNLGLSDLLGFDFADVNNTDNYRFWSEGAASWLKFTNNIKQEVQRVVLSAFEEFVRDETPLDVESSKLFNDIERYYNFVFCQKVTDIIELDVHDYCLRMKNELKEKFFYVWGDDYYKSIKDGDLEAQGKFIELMWEIINEYYEILWQQVAELMKNVNDNVENCLRYAITGDSKYVL